MKMRRFWPKSKAACTLSEAKQSEANERISVQIVCIENNTSVHTEAERKRSGARILLRMYLVAAK